MRWPVINSSSANPLPRSSRCGTTRGIGSRSAPKGIAPDVRHGYDTPLTRMIGGPDAYRTFGRTGWSVGEIGYGMWGLAGWTGSDDAESLASLERAIELGCNVFDTAWAYGGGQRAAAGPGRAGYPGRTLYVATKVPPKNDTWPCAVGSPSTTASRPTTSGVCRSRRDLRAGPHQPRGRRGPPGRGGGALAQRRGESRADPARQVLPGAAPARPSPPRCLSGRMSRHAPAASAEVERPGNAADSRQPGKRSIDVAGALLLCCSFRRCAPDRVAIVLDSPGQPCFASARIGRDREPLRSREIPHDGTGRRAVTQEQLRGAVPRPALAPTSITTRESPGWAGSCAAPARRAAAARARAARRR